MSQTFAPTVLVVDDDPSILDIFSRRFYEDTSLGVLATGNLKDAQSAISDEDVQLDAVVSDIAFTQETQDAENNLYDGLDFLRKALKEKPSMPIYVCSVYSDRKIYKAKAKKMGLTAKTWFQKLEFDGKKPWEKIERDLYDSALENDKELLEKVKKNGFDQDVINNELLDWIRTNIRPIRQTYLQTLPRPLKILKQIRVFCEEVHEEDSEKRKITAEAPGLGLIIPGQGDSVEEAMEDLSDIIYEQYNDFIRTKPQDLVGHAKKVFENMQNYMTLDDYSVA